MTETEILRENLKNKINNFSLNGGVLSKLARTAEVTEVTLRKVRDGDRVTTNTLIAVEKALEEIEKLK